MSWPFSRRSVAGNLMRSKDRQKSLLPIPRWSRPRQTFDRVVHGIKIHLCRKSARMRSERMRLVLAVIDSIDQNVFESEVLFFRLM